METLFLLAFGEEDFLASLATADSEAFFNKLLVVTGHLLLARFHLSGFGVQALGISSQRVGVNL
jgi:hypothetical protein